MCCAPRAFKVTIISKMTSKRMCPHNNLSKHIPSFPNVISFLHDVCLRVRAGLH